MLLSVVEKLGFETNLATDVLEELGNCFNVEILIENAARRSPNRPFPFTGLDESSPSVPAELDADVRETALHRSAYTLDDAIEGCRFARVIVNRNSDPAPTTEQLVNRHVGSFAFQIPERHINAAERQIHGCVVSPERTHIAALPNVFDLVRIATHQTLRQYLDRRRNSSWTEKIACRAYPVKPMLARFDLHEAPACVRACLDRADLRDLQCW